MITNKSTIAQLCSSVYNYNYDNIGNCKSTLENGSNFTPTYALDGNQTKIQSSTGEWLISYNANNRPISFRQGNTRVECNYDYMGRQYLRKVYKNSSSSPSTNERYIYRGYLRLGALNMNNGADFYQALLWDPTEPQATRPLALLNNNGTYYYGHDFNKNVTELFNANGDIVNHYDYRPYGALLESSESIPNPIQYSSEIHDPELGLISYNYRHYNPEDGRWLTRDPIQEDGGLNLYGFVGNNPAIWADWLGLFNSIAAAAPHMTIAEAAALGLITPALLEWARAHGIKRVVDIPQDIADIESLKPPGDCSEEEHRELQNKVKEKCQNIGLRGCKPNMSKEELEANLKKNQECVDARAK